MSDTANKRSALTVATLSAFVTPFMGSAINIAIPSIQREFGIDAVLLSWIATSYLLAAATALVPFGRLADIQGRKKVFAYGMVIFTAASFLSALSPSAVILILFRVLQGIGSSMVFATGIAILTSVFQPQERGKVLGINVAAVYAGLSLGPFLGGFLTQHFGWRSIFLATVPLGLISIALVIWKLKGEWAEAKGEKFDLSGSLIYGMAIVALMYGLSLLPAKRGLGFVVSGFIGIWVFIAWEVKKESPVYDLNLFKTNRVFAFSNLAALINYSATFAVAFLLSLYLQHIKGLSPQNAGIILVAQPIIQTLFSPFAGRLSDRVEPRILATAGMFLTTLGLVFLIFLDQHSALALIVAWLILLGFGFALFSSPNTNAIMGSVERRFYGLASGSVGTMRLLGMMISMGITTMLFSMLIGRVQITAEYYPAFLKSIRVAFIVFSLLCFGGTFASLVRGRTGSYPAENDARRHKKACS